MRVDLGRRVRLVRLLGLEVGGRDLLGRLAGMAETAKSCQQPISGGSGAQYIIGEAKQNEH